MRGWRKSRRNIKKHLEPVLPDINEQLLFRSKIIQKEEEPNDQRQKRKEKEEQKDKSVRQEDIQKNQEFQPSIDSIDHLIDWNQQKQQKLLKLLSQQTPKKTIYKQFIKQFKKSRRKKDEQILSYANFLHKTQQIHYKAFRIVRAYLVAQNLLRTSLQAKHYQQISRKSQGDSIKAKMVKFYRAWLFDKGFRLQGLSQIATDISRALNNQKMREGFLRKRQKKQEKVWKRGEDEEQDIKTKRYYKYKAKKQQQKLTQEELNILNVFKRNIRNMNNPPEENSEEKHQRERKESRRKVMQSQNKFESNQIEKQKRKQSKPRVTSTRKKRGKKQ